MANQAQLALGDSGDAPQSYNVPGAQLIRLLCCNATFDGTGAAGAFLPAVELVSDAGEIASRTLALQVEAGGAAEVTFGPFLSRGAGIQYNVLNSGGFLDVTSQDYTDFKALNFTAEMLGQPGINVALNGLGVDVVANDQTFTQNPHVQIEGGGRVDLNAGFSPGNNPIFVRLDGASGPVPPGGSVRVFVGLQEIFRINNDGSLQGRTGKSLVFNL